MIDHQTTKTQMAKILIIKLGALGDVVRTTALLRLLDAEITWVTSPQAVPLLKGNPYIDSVHCIGDLGNGLLRERYDLVINLEDEEAPAMLASDLNKETIIGAYMSERRVTYTESARAWFDMSLVSRLGKARADELKMLNRKTYQEVVFGMIGRAFRGEEYVLDMPLTKTPESRLVGLEARAGDVWPMKRWNKYEDLAQRLKQAGFKVKTFQQRDRLVDYVDDINECEYVVCGDTLAMHIGLALRKKVVAIFTCTTPHEIHGYGRMIPVVSPLYTKYFYRRDFVPEAADAISMDAVFDAFLQLADTGSKSKAPYTGESDRLQVMHAYEPPPHTLGTE
jgi:heptosyltransferase II